MEKYIVIAHILLNVLFFLYLFFRWIISLFGLNDSEYQDKIRVKTRKMDWVFFWLILVTGLYPIIALGKIDLYHVLKLILLLSVIWLSRYARGINITKASLAGILLIIVSGYSSITDSPKFPKTATTLEASNPELKNMTGLVKGQFIFENTCAPCHGIDGKKGKFQAADLSTSVSTLEQKIDFINSGSPFSVMRSFTNELSQEEIAAVANYIHLKIGPSQ